MTLDEKIELVFFDPSRSRDEYIEYYNKVNPERFEKENRRYRYSPIFLILKDIRYCLAFGKEFNGFREKLNPSNFAAIILIHICLTNTIKKLYFGDFDGFSKKYMGIEDKEEVAALNTLRNAIIHSNYSLYNYVEKNGLGKKTKIYFSLGLYPKIIEKNKNFRRGYPAELYLVNPNRLFTSLEKGLEEFKETLRDVKEQKLRRKLEKNFSLDEWVIIGT